MSASSSTASTTETSSSSTTTTTFVTRDADKQILSVEQAEGAGARVRRSIGRPELKNFDPFLMLDEFKVGRKGGFPDHPHRGFQTVTYMFPSSTGSFEHEDFVGNRGLLNPGSLQWMTAGRGILHSEMPALKEGEIAHGLQLWVNLAAKDKMCKPDYQELPGDKVTTVRKGGIEARVIAGSALGVDSPIYTRTPVHYIHFFMDAGTTLNQPIPEDFNAFLYTIDGDISVGKPNGNKLIGPHHTVTLTRKDGQNGVTVTTFGQPATFVLIAGKPIGEPVVQYGPFVMNTREEIMQAMSDFQSGKNGFEGAPTWEGEIGKRLEL